MIFIFRNLWRKNRMGLNPYNISQFVELSQNFSRFYYNISFIIKQQSSIHSQNSRVPYLHSINPEKTQVSASRRHLIPWSGGCRKISFVSPSVSPSLSALQGQMGRNRGGVSWWCTKEHDPFVVRTGDGDSLMASDLAYHLRKEKIRFERRELECNCKLNLLSTSSKLKRKQSELLSFQVSPPWEDISCIMEREYMRSSRVELFCRFSGICSIVAGWTRSRVGSFLSIVSRKDSLHRFGRDWPSDAGINWERMRTGDLMLFYEPNSITTPSIFMVFKLPSR